MHKVGPWRSLTIVTISDIETPVADYPELNTTFLFTSNPVTVSIFLALSFLSRVWYLHFQMHARISMTLQLFAQFKFYSAASLCPNLFSYYVVEFLTTVPSPCRKASRGGKSQLLRGVFPFRWFLGPKACSNVHGGPEHSTSGSIRQKYADSKSLGRTKTANNTNPCKLHSCCPNEHDRRQRLIIS